MQGVSIVDEGKKGDVCGKATKGTAREEASMSCKGKSVGKEVEESRRKRGGVCD